jgi:hypothetical protein
MVSKIHNGRERPHQRHEHDENDGDEKDYLTPYFDRLLA